MCDAMERENIYQVEDLIVNVLYGNHDTPAQKQQHCKSKPCGSELTGESHD